MKIKKLDQIKLYLNESKNILNNCEKWLLSISFNGFSKRQAKKNIFNDDNRLYLPMAKNISKRLEAIKLIDIKVISREKRDLILDEIASLKYLTNRISKINHMFASKISIIYQGDHRNRKYITLNDACSSSFGINSNYLLDILMDFDFIAVNYDNIEFFNNFKLGDVK